MTKRASQIRIPANYWQGVLTLEIGYPYLTPGSIVFLERELPRTGKALEIGCGGSTIFLAQRSARVTSIESESKWIANTQAALVKHGVDAQARIEHITSEDEIRARCARIPDDWLDVVLIDSGKILEREHLMDLLVRTVKPGGLLVLDNYSKCPYDKALLDGWKLHPFNDVHWMGDGTLVARRPR